MVKKIVIVLAILMLLIRSLQAEIPLVLHIATASIETKAYSEAQTFSLVLNSLALIEKETGIQIRIIKINSFPMESRWAIPEDKTKIFREFSRASSGIKKAQKLHLFVLAPFHFDKPLVKNLYSGGARICYLLKQRTSIAVIWTGRGLGEIRDRNRSVIIVAHELLHQLGVSDDFTGSSIMSPSAPASFTPGDPGALRKDAPGEINRCLRRVANRIAHRRTRLRHGIEYRKAYRKALRRLKRTDARPIISA